MLDLVSNVLLQVDVALIRRGVLFLVRSQVDKQELKQLGHHCKQLVVKVVIELVVELFIGRLSQRLDDVINALADQVFDLVVVLRISIGGVDVSHEVDEQVRNLVDEFEGFAIFENDLFFVSVFVPLLIFFFIVLSLVDLVVRVLHIFAQLQQKLSFVFQEFKQAKVVLFGVESDCSGSGLGAFVDLFDEGINCFTCLDRNIFIFLDEKCIEFVEKVGVVLGRD